jgi:peptidoglycan/LPS O-acetylase OafA/YrhL
LTSARGTYEPSVDGLRAVAILLVLLFHFDLLAAERGYLGVDIFFVVSGYLVGGMVLRDLDSGQFRLTEFLRRRVTRIFPMLALLCILLLVIGPWLLLPADYALTAASVRAAILIHANHHFYATINYFGPGKHDLHLLHSWSLSVEEQFYLLFPIGALILHWTRLPRRWTLAAATLAALGVAEYLRAQIPATAFYWMAGRAWQLLAGVWVASLIKPHGAPPMVIGGAAPAALLLIVGAAFLPATAMPGMDQGVRIAVTAAAALLLLCNRALPQTAAARWLGFGPARLLGQTSYSLYLVHWPLLTLVMTWSMVPLGAFERAMLMLAAILLAWAAWRWVEMPLRRLGNAPHVRAWSVLVGALLVAALIALAAGRIAAAKGWPDRLSPTAAAHLAGASDRSPLRTACHSDEDAAPIPPGRSCRLGAAVEPDVAVWADSHGTELAYAMGRRWQGQGRALIQLTSSGCPPLAGFDRADKPRCRARNDAVLTDLLARPAVRTVILGLYYDGYGDALIAPQIDALAATARRLHAGGKRVVVLGPFPRPDFDVPRVLAAERLWRRGNGDLRLTRAAHDARAGPMLARLRSRLAGSSVQIFDPATTLCGPQLCPLRVGGGTSHTDDNHISVTAALQLAQALEDGLGLSPARGR